MNCTPEPEAEDEAKQPPKRKSSFGLKKDPLTQTGITSFFNAKGEGGGGGAAFKSALELSTKDSEQGSDSIEKQFGRNASSSFELSSVPGL